MSSTETPSNEDTYVSNIAEGSGVDLPAILGLESMAKRNTILILGEDQEAMVMPGNRPFEIKVSPGTKVARLTKCEAGHLTLKCSHFSDVSPAGAKVHESITYHTAATPSVELHDDKGRPFKWRQAEDPSREDIYRLKKMMCEHLSLYDHVKEAVPFTMNDYSRRPKDPQTMGPDKARKAMIMVITQMAEEALGRYDGDITSGWAHLGPSPATATGASSSSAGDSRGRPYQMAEIPASVEQYHIGANNDADL